MNQVEWSGLGMTYNYDGTGASVSQDMDVLYAQGFRRLRMLFNDYTGSSAITTWRGYVTTALSKGFYVVYGITAGFGATTTAANYGAFSTAVQAEATWAQGLGNANLEFQIGNEEEDRVDGTTLTVATMQSNLRSLGTTVKGIYTVGKVSYAASDSRISNWTSGGKGTMDYISFNCYGYLTDFKTTLASIFSTFGTNAYLSEFGPNASGITSSGIDPAQWAARFETQLKLIKASGLPTAYVYTYMDNANIYGVKNTNGIYASYYWYLLSSALPKKEVLIDGFTSINSQLWDDSTSGHGSISSNQLVITSLLAGAYFTLTSHSKYDLTNSQITCQVINAGNQALTSWEVYPVFAILDGNNSLNFKITGNNINCLSTVASVTTSNSIAYNSTIHKYFRIRETSGTVYWDCSADGLYWTNIRSIATPFDVSWVQNALQVGTWQAEGSTTSATFDNFNILGNVGTEYGNVYRHLSVGDGMGRSEGAT